ncbi:MAG TPA: ABC transporter permease [Candidatus Eisenbacteria bacterium]|nr:ABC transporter permease [Candidatus Eisenbacteria bacterium]
MAIPIVYNLRSALQRPVATFTTAAGIGLTIAIFIGALALGEGFRRALVSTGSPDNALVLRKGADSEISGGITVETANILRSNPAVATDASGHPLASAELVVVVNKPRLGQQGSSNVTVRGVDPAAIGVRANIRIVDGRMFRPGSDEIIVARRIAGRFANCGLGDRLHFEQRAFTVVGHFTAGGSEFDSEIWGDAAVLMPAMHRDGVFQTVVFRMRHPADFPRLKRELEADPRLQVDVYRERDFYADQSRAFTVVIRVIGTFITVIMAVGAMFGAANTMYAAIGARAREIATLLVLGFRPWAVMLSFVTESVIVAVFGGLIGCALALPINGITSSTTNFQSFSEQAFQFQVTPGILLQGLVFAAVLGVLGGFFPALKAARQPLASALRGG